MSINKIDNINIFLGVCPSNIDSEEKEILRRLLYKYGIRGTGNKTTDKRILHELELKEAKREDTVSSKFLTVTQNEQEKIQEIKKDKRVDANPKAHPNTSKGARILGEQIYLAIQMKKDIEDRFKKKKSKD